MSQKDLIKKALSLVADAEMTFPICVTYEDHPECGDVLSEDSIIVPFTRLQLLFFIRESIYMDDLFAGIEIAPVDIQNLIYDAVMRNFGNCFSGEIECNPDTDSLENYQYSWKYLVDGILSGKITETNFDKYFEYFRNPVSSTVLCIDEWMDK